MLDILLVEDNPGDARLLMETLRSGCERFELRVAQSLSQACAAISSAVPDVVLLDLSLPDSNGTDTIRGLLAGHPLTAVVVLTGLDDSLGVEAVRAGAQDYLVKGQFDDRLLTRSIRYAIERQRNEAERQKLLAELQQAHDRLEQRVAEQTEHLTAAVDALQSEVTERLAVEQALRASEGRYRTLLDLAPIGIAVADPSGAIVSANQSLRALLGAGEREILGRCLGWMFADEAEHQKVHGMIVSGQRLADYEVQLKRPDGQVITALLDGGRITAGPHSLLLLVVRDITQRKQDEQALQVANELLETVFANIHVMIAYMDRDFNFIRVNSRYAHAVGNEPDFFVGKNHFDLYPNAENLAIFRRVVRSGRPFSIYEKPFEYPDRPGEVTYWDWSLGPIKSADGKVTGVILSLLDVTERKRLADEVMHASELERQRIGQDLHDGLGQSLTGLAFLSSVLHGQLATASRPEAQQARLITDQLNKTIGLTRSLARGLCPVELTSEALMKALGELASDTTEMFRIDCRFECPRGVLVDDINVATHLYRIAQEAVSNAHRHGQASSIVLSLECSATGLCLRVRDNGRGFDPHNNGHEGMGLKTMEHRAKKCEGTLDVLSVPGGGTEIVCNVSAANARVAMES